MWQPACHVFIIAKWQPALAPHLGIQQRLHGPLERRAARQQALLAVADATRVGQGPAQAGRHSCLRRA